MMRTCNAAMETPASLLMLIVAAMTISAVVLSQAQDGSDQGLSSLRIAQAGSLAGSLSVYRDPEGRGLPDLIGQVPFHLYRYSDGSVEYFCDPGSAREVLDVFMAYTPDDLEVSVLISDSPDDLPPLTGSRFSRSVPLGPGLFLTVTLPHHRGSMHPEDGP